MRGFFDLEDLSAHVAEQHGAIGTGEYPGQIDDAESVQRWHEGGKLYRYLRFLTPDG